MIGVYFSGTGNTKYCIEKFLSCLEGDIPAVSIENPGLPDLLKQHSELILAYPIYFSSLPKIVKDFICREQEAFRGKKVFIMATMGLFSGDGSGCSARLLRKYGAAIIGGLHLKMPDCISDVKALKRTASANRLLVAKANMKLERAARQLRNGAPPQEGLSLLSHAAGLFGQRLWFSQKTKHYTNKLKIDADRCSGCGACVRVCPMYNLSIVDQKATSKGRCTMCYRCISNCPRQAITLLGDRVWSQGHIEDYL